MDTDARRGVLLRIDGSLCFIPASIAVRVAPPPRLSPVPGAPPDLLGIALYDGMVIPVIAIGPGRSEMMICQHGGELLGLVGGEVVKTGSFGSAPDRPDLVEHEGHPAASLDLPAIYARIQSSARPGRWGG
jgi:hypothetical protein